MVTALAVLTTALSVLASGQGTGNIAIGAVAVVGFLAAAGRKQYVLRAEEGSLYPALQRLLRERWVVADWGISARNRKVRTYKLTPTGRRQLDREIAGFERLLAGIGRVMRPAES